MPRDLRRGKCVITTIIDRNTNKDCTDWKSDFIGKQGYGIIEESVKKAPGKRMLYFVLPHENRYIHTSIGDLETNIDSSEGVEHYKLVTRNSIYYFIMKDTQEIQPSLFNKDNKKENEKDIGERNG